MKKFFVIAMVLLCFASVSFAGPKLKNKIVPDSVIVAWDAVSFSGNVKYQIYTKSEATTAEAVAYGEPIESTQKTLKFTVPGKYYICVDARSEDNGASIKSDMACSYNPDDCQGGQPWSVTYKPSPPPKPKNLRTE